MTVDSLKFPQPQVFDKMVGVKSHPEKLVMSTHYEIDINDRGHSSPWVKVYTRKNIRDVKTLIHEINENSLERGRKPPVYRVRKVTVSSKIIRI